MTLQSAFRAGLGVTSCHNSTETARRRLQRVVLAVRIDRHGERCAGMPQPGRDDRDLATYAGSRSETARKARRNGTPVTSYSAFADALLTGRPLEVATMSSSGMALVCTECGSSWIAPRRLKNSVCADSASWQRPAEASNQAVVGAVPRRRAGASCLSVSLDEFLHNDADGLGDAGIGPTYHLVKDISDLGIADSGALALLHREKQVIVSVERGSNRDLQHGKVLRR